MRFPALFASSLALSGVLVACTETPSYFPPCVDPYTPCMSGEGGADASDGGETDVPAEATTTLDAH